MNRQPEKKNTHNCFSFQKYSSFRFFFFPRFLSFLKKQTSFRDDSGNPSVKHSTTFNLFFRYSFFLFSPHNTKISSACFFSYIYNYVHKTGVEWEKKTLILPRKKLIRSLAYKHSLTLRSSHTDTSANACAIQRRSKAYDTA